MPQAAVDELIRAALPLVDRLVRRFLARRPAWVDRDAIRGAANEALVRAARSYQPSRGVPFDAWAHQRITGAMLDEQRALSFGARGKPLTLLPLEEHDAADVNTADRVAMRLDLRHALQALPAPERLIVVAGAAGYALHELSALLNVSEGAVWQRKQRAHAACSTRLAA
jgi:RNA polymerase sigma factor (sigma-70 family)